MESNSSTQKIRILMSIPSKSHVEIAQDELNGLQALGYHCGEFLFAAKNGVSTTIGRAFVLVRNAVDLIRKAYQFKPDVIYFNSRLELIGSTRDFLTILLFKSFYFKKVSLIIKSHGSELELLNDERLFIKKLILPFLKRNVAAWLFLSSEEKNNVIANGFLDAESVFVTKNVVRINQFNKHKNFKAELGVPSNELILLFTGRLIREKGIYELLDAFAKLQKNQNITLIIVGDGPELETLKEQVGIEKLGGKVIFTGFIPEQEVVRFYANSDILVFPTYCSEGFPMALFNAVAAGMAIVTTPIRAAKDYLVSPLNCLWVEAKNSESVETALVQLLETQALRQQMRLENLEKAKLFSEVVVCSEISVVIKTVLAHHKPAKNGS